MSQIEERLIARIRARAEFGTQKYGTTMDRDDLMLHDWIVHAQEEAIDLGVYSEKIRDVLLWLANDPNADVDFHLISLVNHILGYLESVLLALEAARGRHSPDMQKYDDTEIQKHRNTETQK